jgi:hypothetical protein
LQINGAGVQLRDAARPLVREHIDWAKQAP